jgi:flagella basal body P-ring formation protein FlgA
VTRNETNVPGKFWRCVLTALCFTTQPASADELRALTPKRIIYPGDPVQEDALEEKLFQTNGVIEGAIVRSRDEIVGKIARRTLIPGQPIAISGLDTPRVIKVGASVKIIYASEGLQIIATGVAQQAGGVGDTIRVRNEESGIFVSGRVMPDGSILVGES